MKTYIHNTRNELTEHSNNHRLINPHLLQCYAALSPATMVKLSICLFQIFIKSRIYNGDPEEEKRIYMDKPIGANRILKECYPEKYNIEGKQPKKDYSNLSKALKKLHDNNIFYMWAYKTRPRTQIIFIMERDIGVWKHYNPQAYVPPKTMMKILNCSQGMIDAMVIACGEHEKPLIEKSMASFIQDMLKKMSPSVQEKLPVQGHIDLQKYKENLIKLLGNMNDFEGVAEHDSFPNRLPISVEKELAEKRKSNNGAPSKKPATKTDEIIPQHADLTKIKQPKKRKPQKDPVPEFVSNKERDPFNNVNDFLQFYQAKIKQRLPNAQFRGHGAERIEAGQILDLLIESNLEGDKEFLSAWISHFMSVHLRGNKSRNPDKTSLKEFKATFNRYYSRHYSMS